MPTRQTKEQKLEFVKSLPRKRIVASLVAYHGGRLFIVKPTYREGWLLPGGVIEAGESPAAGCVRVAVAGCTAHERARGAESSFQSAMPGVKRMDAVMYCVGAMEKFDRMTPEEVQDVAFEIGALGAGGINMGDPDQHYHLRSLPGEFTGLHLVCLMYVGFKRIMPEADIGFDLGGVAGGGVDEVEDVAGSRAEVHGERERGKGP